MLVTDESIHAKILNNRQTLSVTAVLTWDWCHHTCQLMRAFQVGLRLQQCRNVTYAIIIGILECQANRITRQGQGKKVICDHCKVKFSLKYKLNAIHT